MEVSRDAIRGTPTVYEWCFASAGALAHVGHLALQGRAGRIEDGEVAVYRRP